MEGDNKVYHYGKFFPDVDESVFLAPGARVVGKVIIGAQSSVWYNAVVRGDADSITIGGGTNIQDNCTLHADQGFPLVIGDRISIGHNSVLHGCIIEDDALVGMGSTILNGAKIGAGAVVGAGSVVIQGMEVPPGHLVMGVPAKIIRPLREGEADDFQVMAERYRRRSRFVLGLGPTPD